MRVLRNYIETLHELRTGSFQSFRHRVGRLVRQEWTAYGLRRDLDHPHASPTPRISIAIREIEDRDIEQMFVERAPALPRKERLEIANRMAHLAERIPTCYVAIDRERNTPCFVQWLMTASANEQIARFFRGRFPALQGNEALLENAYTPPQYRGQGIMPAAMSMIAEHAREFGCRYVHTYVLKDNVPSLKGCSKAGFSPFIVRRDIHLLFHLIRYRTFSSHIA
jgi:GNAT superfamily N-acetyltransferase